VDTPPIPDTTHSVQGGVAAQILRRFFGTDGFEFATWSTTLPEVRAPLFLFLQIFQKQPRRTGSHGFMSVFTFGRLLPKCRGKPGPRELPGVPGASPLDSCGVSTYYCC
jgi:hypothetical protein